MKSYHTYPFVSGLALLNIMVVDSPSLFHIAVVQSFPLLYSILLYGYTIYLYLVYYILISFWFGQLQILIQRTFLYTMYGNKMHVFTVV